MRTPAHTLRCCDGHDASPLRRLGNTGCVNTRAAVVATSAVETLPAGARRSTGIEALRGIAAVMVLSVHSLSLLVPASENGLPGWAIIRNQFNSGFQLFFVVSGFLIAGPFIRDVVRGNPLPSLWPYALRRILRIGPAFWLVLLVFALVSLNGWNASDWIAVITHATFTQDLVPHQSGSVLPVAWTLSIEAMFYAFVPVAALLIRRGVRTVAAARLERWILVGWTLSVVWELGFSLALHGPYGSAAVSPQNDTLKLFTISLPGMFCMFCPGMLVALWRVADRNVSFVRRRPGMTILAGCALWFVAAVVQATSTGALAACCGDQLRGVAFGAVLLGVINRQRAPGLLLRAFAGLGVVSYGIYLWHWLVIHGIEIGAGRAAPFGGALGTPIAIAVSLAATLPLAVISWYIVESPCMRLASAVARRPVADIPAAALELGVARAPAAPEAR